MGLERAGLVGTGLAPYLQGDVHRELPSRLLVGPLSEMHVLELERFLVEFGIGVVACVLPRGDVREVLVVAEGFSVVGLMFDAEVTAAALLAVQRVPAQQLSELEEVSDSPRLLK